MISDNLKLLLKLYYRPLAAIGGIIDEGSLLFAVLAVVAVSFLVNAGITSHIFAEMARAAVRRAQEQQQQRTPEQGPGRAARPRPVAPEGEDEPAPVGPASALPYGRGTLIALASTTSTLTIVVALSVLYVPATLFVVTLLEPVGSLGVAFRRDYGSLLACTLMAWAAAYLPFSFAALALGAAGAGLPAVLALLGAGTLYFAALMVLAVRTVFGARLTSALAAVGLSWLSLGLQPYLALLASPFALYWGYQYFHGDVGDIAWSFGARQGFKRYLEAATINPRDAGAHYQLGLIHQHRRQIPEAVARFKRAVEIDPTELDAHYQLGRIAREQQRHEDAIGHFEAVVSRDERFARHEVWREIGGTYLESRSLDHARWALEKYVAQRSHDPEGLYYLGETLIKLGQADEARRQLVACLEAADTTPSYRRREVRRWRKAAEQQLAALERG